MTDESRRLDVAAEVEKGEASLRAARALFGLGLHDDCVGRAYHAAAFGVLMTSGLDILGFQAEP